MIEKLLIANRGEIAVRIIRACTEAGITSVAIYADADRHALHVKKADEAYNIGPESLAGYLNAYRIVNLAVATGCDAVHPGYGFLSENPLLPEICKKRGVCYIGSDADVIRQMGDKIQARRAMLTAGIPVVPGSDGNLENLDEAIRLADEIGYPVMLKATAGGGGRGIRRCNSEAELRKNYDRVRSETSKAFGSSDIFMERCIDRPRHIEVQILADHHGNVVHLFERDCSIQRRHQKLIEIAPSPQLNDEQRKWLGDTAVRAASAVNYKNAGTVEFLLDTDGNFYFMEMNTRIQVEHGVTELVTGLDLVKWQIRIAAGATLSVKQKDVKISGHAIECRINAEDPVTFRPSPGLIEHFHLPGGPGVRVDSAAYAGYRVPPHYDSMIAKLMTHGADREEAMARMVRALDMTIIEGIATNIALHQDILVDDDFIRGQFTTQFIELFFQKKNQK